MSIEDRVKKILAGHLRFDVSAVTGDKLIVADLGADSLDEIELVMALEDEFDIEISDDDAAKFTTVQQVIDYITAEVPI